MFTPDDFDLPDFLRIAPPPEKAARTPNWEAWAKMGSSSDSSEEARARVHGDRQTRKKARGTSTLTVSVPAPLLHAFDAFVDRWDVSRSQAVRSFIEKALREYGNDEELEHAGLRRVQEPTQRQEVD